jgi:hypothetical protein
LGDNFKQKIQITSFSDSSSFERDSMLVVPGSAVQSPAEKPWLEFSVVGDVMSSARARGIHSSKTSDATIHSEKKTYLTTVLFGKMLC